ncbi:MAG TPA: PhzF family phenazine biosynthesis protein [Paucimonas sp.]|nr:PhzF family phenazine biosynthesis protein [Paucimonas sp.]
MTVLDYRLVDVFTSQPLSGNSLTVFFLNRPLPDALLQAVTREMRHFESIFLWETPDPHCFRARIFTMEEELPFAGHPVIGAACALHAERFAGTPEVALRLQLAERGVPLVSRRGGGHYSAEMEQGTAVFSGSVPREGRDEVLAALNLRPDDLVSELPLEVVSTGLPYLIVPIRKNLAEARIVARDFDRLLARFGASFVYVIDVPTLEGRTWDNDGRVEDIATGSAAGPAAAYLVRHGYARPDLPLVLHQGRFLGRPSQLIASVDGEHMSVRVRGDVAPVGGGTLDLRNSPLL